jgi:hypothetical protein
MDVDSMKALLLKLKLESTAGHQGAIQQRQHLRFG